MSIWVVDGFFRRRDERLSKEIFRTSCVLDSRLGTLQANAAKCLHSSRFRTYPDFSNARCFQAHNGVQNNSKIHCRTGKISEDIKEH